MAILRKLLITNDLIKLLQDSDPAGNCVIRFVVHDRERFNHFIAHGEIDHIQIYTGKRLTSEGEKDTIGIVMELENDK